MLNVPDEIKELLHRDNCMKNIRIHFPNMERADICNDQIVFNSVKFTESLCSQNTLKFGLCEASVFECEVVGVSNVAGATIEVTCEVFCPSTVEGAEWKADLEQWVYSIPYGTFVIDEAKRQADIIHRKIVAYGGVSYLNVISDECKTFYWRTGNYPTYSWYETAYKVKSASNELIKDVLLRKYGGNYTYDAIKRLYARFNCNLFQGTTFTDTSGSGKAGSMQNRISFNSGVVNYNLVLEYRGVGYQYSDDKLLYIETPDFSMSKEEILERIDSMVYALYSEGKILLEDYTRTMKYIKKWIYNYYDIYGDFNWGHGDGFRYPIDICTAWDGQNFNSDYGEFVRIEPDNQFFLYPYFKTTNTSDDNSRGVYVLVPYAIRLESASSSPDVIDSFQFRDLPVFYGAKAYEVSNELFGLISFTQQREKYTDQNNATGYRLKNPLTNSDYLNALASAFELQGLFGRNSRNNVINYINIKQQFDLLPETNLYPASNLYPEGVTGGKLLPEDYQTCWYSDEYTKPYGAVRCQYKNTSNEDCLFTLYLTGYNAETPTDSYRIYELKDNYYIQNSTWTQTQIEAICNTIAANVSGVTYMPVEFVGRGLPYVEAGDTFEILTGSNDSITTIVLRRTISGEMVLTDSYKSV